MLSARYPELEDTPEAAEGTAAHWAASEMLHGRVICEGQIAPNGVTLTDEMIEGAELYVDDVRLTLQIFGIEMHIEEPIKIPYVHELNDGTPDLWGFAHDATRGTGTLYLYEYKHGHEYVDPFENWQSLDYVCGILDLLQIDGHADQYIDVVMRVVQPRSYHRDGPIKEWRMRAADLRPYFNKLRYAAEAALKPDAQCTPNPQCKHCLGRHACEALQRDAYQSAQLARASVPVELPPAALGLELRMLQRAADMLQARITGLEQQTETRLKQGEHVPFFALQPTAGREMWAKPIEEVIVLGHAFGKDLAKRSAVTPTQAIKQGIPAEVVMMYTDRKRGQKLAPDDGTQARKVFAKQY